MHFFLKNARKKYIGKSITDKKRKITKFTVFAMKLKIELSCILFPLIIHEIFYNSGSQPCPQGPPVLLVLDVSLLQHT